MTVDQINIGLSFLIFILYLITFYILIEIKKKLNKESGRSFIYLMIGVFVLALRRLWEIFVNTEIVAPIDNLTDLASLIFAILFFCSVNSFYKSLKKAGARKRSNEDYKKIIGRI